MAAPPNYFKLGVFVIIALAGVIGAVLLLGAQKVSKESVTYHTYFNESVHGLDVGSPVKFRGVTVGAVSAIAIAPDRRHVDVSEELDADAVLQIGLKGTHGESRQIPDLRAQLGTQGITGVKFVEIDFFDPKANPVPELSFRPSEKYIPAAPSMMKSLEDTLSRALDKFPELVDAVDAITGRVDRVMAQLEREDLAGSAVTTLRKVDDVLASLTEMIHRFDRAGVPDKAARALDGIGAAVAKLDHVIDRVDGEDGILTSIRRASDAVGGFGRGATAATRELDQTLREIRDAAESIRVLSDEIERDPDILVKGRAKAKGTSR